MKPSALLRVPFGLHNGVLVEPGSVENGKACGCVCPGCARPLIAYNEGKLRTTQYFGHVPGEDCGRGIESAIHLAGKAALVREKRMARPALVVGIHGILGAAGYSTAQVMVEDAACVAYASVIAEVTIGLAHAAPAPEPQADLFAVHAAQPPVYQTLRPDLQATGEAEVDWVEIRVTHAVDREKQQALQTARLRVIEVDLSEFLRIAVDLTDIQKAITDDFSRKAWLAHPGVPAAINSARAEAARQADAQRRVDVFRRIEAEAANRPPRVWVGDGVPPEPPIVIPKVEQNSPDRYRSVEVELRRRLGLTADERWPKHLHLDVAGNAGSLAPARLWVAQLYLDWVHGHGQGRFLLTDLVNAVARKFGVETPHGHRDIQGLLARRVLPYWEACGFVRLLEDEAIELTGKAAPARRS